jgi:ABC-type uncharacterized transport system substrate-binding protein
MRRRDLLVVFFAAGAGLLRASGFAADNPIRIGVLPMGSPTNPYDQSLVEALRSGLRGIGLVENRNVTLDVGWIRNEAELPQVVRDLVQRGAKLLVTSGSSASAAAKQYTSTLPIVFVPVGNPVGIGMVESLSRPGGNATGLSDVLADLSGKFVQFAVELGKPQAPIDYLWFPKWPDGPSRFRSTQAAAEALRLRLRSRKISDIAEADDVLGEFKKDGAQVVILQPSPFTYTHRTRLTEAAAKHGLATINGFPIAAREGAVVAYGPAYPYMSRRAALYVDRILKGTNPAEIPVEEPSKFELVVNLKTARSLGLDVPYSLLGRADEVIE